MKLLVTSFGLVILTLPSARASDANPCGVILGERASANPILAAAVDGTEGFIAYLGRLLEQRLVGNRELGLLIDGIETRNEITNPVPHEMSRQGPLFARSADQIHYEALEEYIRHSRLDHKKIRVWALSAADEKKRVQGRREETRAETQSLYQAMAFHRVEGGSFEMGEPGRKVKVTLSHPFEMMSTLVTQKMWVEEMGENPSWFKDGETKLVISKSGKSIAMRPDYPVENFTWWSAVTFANRLSEKINLKPAYDLSNITDWVGSAELGTLKPRDEEGANALLRINAPGGDIYLAEGFRLPTEAEQEYVRTDRGRSQDNYFSGVNRMNLREYAWFVDNVSTGSQHSGATRPVAQLLAQTIDGKDFYDLHGNVWEWGHDLIWKGEGIKGGTDPSGLKVGSARCVRGGGADSPGELLQSATRGFQVPSHRACLVGLRLVRTVLEGGGK